jgi:hypothetical protein
MHANFERLGLVALMSLVGVETHATDAEQHRSSY